MAGGALSCPPGFWCMDTGMIFLLVLVVGLMAVFVVFLVRQSAATGKEPPSVAPHELRPVLPPRDEQPKPVRIELVHTQVPVQQMPPSSIDYRFQPPSPERMYVNPDSPAARLAAMMPPPPLNEMTRPSSGMETFQQIGVLTAPGGSETSASPNRTILPLFGKRAVIGRDRWNYYTRTDGMNPVQVPVQYKRRNCDEDNGCDEITTGDNVAVPILGQSYVANVYRYSTPVRLL
jgi:hypothetical protein